MEDYLTCLMEILQAVKQNTSPESVYPILEKHLEKLDENLAKILESWATDTLSQAESEEAQAIAVIFFNFATLLQQFPLGSRANKIEIAITAYQISLQVFTPNAFPYEWARTQNNIVNAYRNRIRGERAENLEMAIAACQEALKVYTFEAFPVDWAMTQNNLGSAYSYRIRGERADNLEIAIAIHQEALKVYSFDAFPYEWAATQNSLADAYSKRIKGEWAKNLETAINCFQEALKVRTFEAFPIDWAMTQNSLGSAYSYRIRGERADNLEMALAFYREALKVYTLEAFPDQWAMTQNNLGNAYCDRIRGERTKNLETAIDCFQKALKVYTCEAFPYQWATTQNNLASTYIYRIRGKRSENLELAIAACQEAFKVYTVEAFPYQWAMTQNNLAIVYYDRIRGERSENLEQAIAANQEAIKVYTFEAFPYEWARSQNNLASAYIYRIRGERSENLEMAFAACQEALKVRTFDTSPVDWAMTQNNLAIVYFDRIRGERSENLEQAIAAYQETLKVYTFEAFPVDWARTKNNLANAYLERIKGEWEDNLEKAIAACQEALKVRTCEDFPVDWAGTQNNLGNIYRVRIRGKQTENLEMAIAANQEALKVYTFEDFPVDWARTENNLGEAYRNRIRGERTENLEMAINYFREALKVYTFEAFPYEWAMSQNNLGNAYRERIRGEKDENLKTAINCFQEVLLVRTFDAFPQHNTETLFYLGVTYRDAQRLQEAYNLLQNAINTVDILRGEIVSGDEIKGKQAEKWNPLYLNIVEICLELGNITTAIEYVERSKTRNLVELILERNSKTIFPPDIFRQLEQLRDEIAIGQYQIQNGKAKNSRILAQHLQQLRQQRNELQNRYLPVSFGFKFDSFQATLDERTAIIEWYILNEKILAFIVKPTGEVTVWQSQPEDRQALINWANQYSQNYNNQQEQWQKSLGEELKKLASILHIDEILTQIPNNCDKLILIPHRYLHLFPLHALPVDSETCLLDHFSRGVHYTPSCQLLQQVQQQPRPQFQRFFAIQTPTVDLYEKDLGIVKAIQSQFTNDSPILKRDKATKSAILNHPELQSTHSAFFFCHGYFNPNSALDSGLQLADDVLTLEEIIANFNLQNCRLVTLAACETGLTDSTKIIDEYIGLPSGFLLAGSTNVVCSLWPVNSLPTALIMLRFYQELQKQDSIAIALNTAQRWLRDTTIQGFQAWLPQSQLSLNRQIELGRYFNTIEKERGATAKPFQSPYHWAAFCAIGKGEEKMSVDIYGTMVFIDLYKSGLISDQDWNEFYQQTRHLQDDEDIARVLGVWLRAELSREPILQAYKGKMNVLLSSSNSENILMGWSEIGQSPVQPNQPSSRDLLDNAIIPRRPSPEPPPQ